MTNNTIHSNNVWSVWKIAKTLFHCAWLRIELFKKFLNIFRRYSYITSPYGRMNLAMVTFSCFPKVEILGYLFLCIESKTGRLSLLFNTLAVSRCYGYTFLLCKHGNLCCSVTRLLCDLYYFLHFCYLMYFIIVFIVSVLRV